MAMGRFLGGAGSARGVRLSLVFNAALAGLLTVGFAGGLTAGLAGPAQAGPVPGTPVSLDPPKGFEPTTNFPGFADRESGASIMVSQFPAPIAEFSKGFTPERLASRRIKELSRETVQVAGRSATLLKLSQIGDGMEVFKWALISGDATSTTLVLGTWLKADGPVQPLDAPLRKSLLSTTWSARTIDPFEGLSFRVTPTDRLKVASTVGGALLLTSSGTIAPDKKGDPLLVVAPSIQTAIVGNLREFSEKRAAQIAQVTQLRNLTGKTLTIDGLQAYELVADAVDATNPKQRLKIYQLLMQTPGKDGYFLTQGLMKIEQSTEFLPIVRQVSQSFKRQVNSAIVPKP
jgi:hypothetical protein